MRDAGHRTPDIGQRTAEKAKIICPPPLGGTNLSKTKIFFINKYTKHAL